MKNLTKTVLASLLFSAFSSIALAGGDHKHGHGHSHEVITISKTEVINRASTKVIQLVKSQKVASSWKDAIAMDAIQKNFGHDDEWVVTFKNTEVADQSKQILYIFFSLDGHYIASNFTGN